MRKLQIADADMMRITLQREIQQPEKSPYDHKLHGILPVAAGHVQERLSYGDRMIANSRSQNYQECVALSVSLIVSNTHYKNN